jgi:hypothetical protein
MPKVQHLLLSATFLIFTACGGGGEDDSATPDTDADPTTTETVDNANTLAGCVGPHAGTFSGDLSGPSEGEVNADGSMTFAFTSSYGTFNLSGTVEADGSVAAGDGVITASGTYDFETCSASGTWEDSSLGVAGEWFYERDA